MNIQLLTLGDIEATAKPEELFATEADVKALRAENERLREEVESNCMAANFWWREAYRANKQKLPRPSKEKDRECLKRIAELESAEAERDELREALSHIRDFPWSASNVQAVARQALWQEGGADDE